MMAPEDLFSINYRWTRAREKVRANGESRVSGRDRCGPFVALSPQDESFLKKMG
jgi:hypothetical protein